jgi:hypothetical protein
MARPCTICTHPEREAIDARLVEGESFRNIVERYDVSLGAVNRHNASHIPEALARAAEASEVAHADNLLDQVRRLQASTLNILRKAEKAEEYRTALMAIREARGNLELLARLMGELNEGAVVNVLVNPEWHHVRTVIVESLGPYPEARAAVAVALEELDHASA